MPWERLYRPLDETGIWVWDVDHTSGYSYFWISQLQVHVFKVKAADEVGTCEWCPFSLTWLYSNYLEYTFPRHFPSALPRERSMAPEQNFYFSTTVTSNISGFSTCFGENIKCYNVVFIQLLQIWVHFSVSQLSSFTKQEIKKRSDRKGLLNIRLILFALLLCPGPW